ncbi:MAG: hypothetical protein Q9169_001798 [Polycauliona sp. 2 TL-2023]
MDLGTFLTDSSLGSWADEMENTPLPIRQMLNTTVDDTLGVETNLLKALVQTTALATDLMAQHQEASAVVELVKLPCRVREQLPLPSKPPYTVHLGNMSFDALEGDVKDFFADCEVTSVRIVEDKMDRKPKGFGYAEFRTVEGLKKALDLSGTQFQGRNIRISVAEPQKDRPEGREINDWTRKGPLPDLPNQRRVSDRGGFGAPRNFDDSRSFDNVSEAGSDRGGRRPFDQGDGKVRDFGNWERKGPLQSAAPTPSGPPRSDISRPISRDGPNLRRNSPAWGEGRSQEGSRPPRREFAERPAVERAPTAAEKDSQWRNNMRPDAPSAPPARSPALSNRDSSTPSSPLAAPATLPTGTAPAAPASRPKLNLTKRTVSEAPSEAPQMERTESKNNPFGAAKPIDTATKEKEIEEKREAEKKERKEAEDKAREEKKIADEKAREEKRAAKDTEKAGNPDRSASSKEKSNGVESEKETAPSGPPPGKSYEILRRQANEDVDVHTEGVDGDMEGDANGLIADDKSVKPQEIVRDIPNGNSASNANATAEPTAEAMEADGWSTVQKQQKPRKNQRNGNGNANAAARAIAS